MKNILSSSDLKIAVKEYFEKRNFKIKDITFTNKDVFDHTDGWYTYYKPNVGAVVVLEEVKEMCNESA